MEWDPRIPRNKSIVDAEHLADESESTDEVGLPHDDWPERKCGHLATTLRDADGISVVCECDLPPTFGWRLRLYERRTNDRIALVIIAATIAGAIGMVFAMGHVPPSQHSLNGWAVAALVLGGMPFLALVGFAYLLPGVKGHRLSNLRYCERCDVAYVETNDTIVQHHHPHGLLNVFVRKGFTRSALEPEEAA